MIKYVITVDDFCPNFPDNKVEVELIEDLLLVSVWGEDDMGYSYEANTYEEALSVYNNIKNHVSTRELEDLGFKIG